MECLELDPHNSSYNSTILFNKALALTKLNKNEEALVDLNVALELNPDYLKAQAKRAEINLLLEKY